MVETDLLVLWHHQSHRDAPRMFAECYRMTHERTVRANEAVATVCDRTRARRVKESLDRETLFTETFLDKTAAALKAIFHVMLTRGVREAASNFNRRILT